MAQSRSENTELRWIVSKVLVCDVATKKYVLTTLYGYVKSEMSIASIEPIEFKDKVTESLANRVCYLTGNGSSFIFPDTRLRVNVERFLSGRLSAQTLRKYVPGIFKMGRIKCMNDSEKFICQVAKDEADEIQGVFSYLSLSEVKSKRKTDGSSKRQSKTNPSNNKVLDKKPEPKLVPKPDVQHVKIDVHKMKGIPKRNNERSESPVLEKKVDLSDAEVEDLDAIHSAPVTSSSETEEQEAPVPMSLPDFILENVKNKNIKFVKSKYLELGEPADMCPDLSILEKTYVTVGPKQSVVTIEIGKNNSVLKSYLASTTIKSVSALKTTRGTRLVFIRQSA